MPIALHQQKNGHSQVLVSTIQAAGGGGRIIADNVHPFMATVYGLLAIFHLVNTGVSYHECVAKQAPV